MRARFGGNDPIYEANPIALPRGNLFFKIIEASIVANFENPTNTLHIMLKELLDKKSKRDQVTFTTYQLANALKMPKSILVRLIHPDPSKRVTNPRIETLMKIIDFFNEDGFDITIDELLARPVSKAEKLEGKALEIKKSHIDIPIYSFDICKSKQLGSIGITLAEETSSNIIAFYADEDIKPMFKKGSIFIIDVDAIPENDNLIAVKIEGVKKIQIKKYYTEGKNKKILKSYDKNDKPIVLMPTMNYRVLGVVIQVNART